MSQAALRLRNKSRRSGDLLVGRRISRNTSERNWLLLKISNRRRA
jgi:hypothetical protein